MKWLQVIKREGSGNRGEGGIASSEARRDSLQDSYDVHWCSTLYSPWFSLWNSPVRLDYSQFSFSLGGWEGMVLVEWSQWSTYITLLQPWWELSKGRLCSFWSRSNYFNFTEDGVYFTTFYLTSWQINEINIQLKILHPIINKRYWEVKHPSCFSLMSFNIDLGGSIFVNVLKAHCTQHTYYN